MLKVELDIFSGRPNPSWTLSGKDEQQLIDRVQADPSIMVPVTAPAGGLGYRGYIVSTIKEKEVGGQKTRPLPSRFRIGGEIEKDKSTSLWLLDTSELPDTEVDDYIRGVAAETIWQRPEAPAAPIATDSDGMVSATDKGTLQACGSNLFTSSTDFSFWNGSGWVTKNNCYNFAANLRTDTFAQPGRNSGHLLTALNCSNVSTAAVWDGWAATCQPANNLTVCLVIWKNVDYHWYRKCANGVWCHKPGQTAARNYDNSGVVITNPETCNRGNYRTFCGYWYADDSVIVVS
jgi:hypothetical protein